MIRNLHKKFANHTTNTQGLIKSEEGVAAIEFGLVAPFIFLFMVGAINLFDGYQGAQSYQNAGTTLVDLVTRHETTFGDEERDNIFATAEALLGDYGSNGDFKISITSVENVFDSASSPELTIAWSKANIENGEVTLADLANYDIPNIPEGGTIILLEISGSYEPYISTANLGTYNYSRYFIRRPRFLDSIPYGN